MTFRLSSSAFDSGRRIPDKHARDGGNEPPPLKWSGAPKETRSFALIVEDPDAPSGVFRHWGAYDIRPERTKLVESGRDGRPSYLEAVNDFGAVGYDGPQPPKGHGVHHYHFRLLALDADHLSLANDASVADVLEAARPHVIGEAELVGTFER